MRNSIKFFLGGVVAATLIFVAFAFTAKQTENKEYLVIRLVEARSDFIVPLVQICDGKGNLISENKSLVNGAHGLDKDGMNTKSIALLLNEYSAKGYSLNSTSVSSFQDGFKLVTTFILEK